MTRHDGQGSHDVQVTACGPRRGFAARVLLTTVRWYQRYVSPLSGPRCRYYPTCSSYAVTALEKHGAVRGTRLALWRLLRCNPWTDGGIDDVPAPAATSR